MIHYQLRCGQDHRFDGWFKDSVAYETQAGHGLVACPECGDTGVNRALMAPALAKARAAATVDQSGAPQGETAPVMPDGLRAALQRLRSEVEAQCEYVGGDFAEEARRIHCGERVRTGIYGEATPDQAEALADEGIAVARIPWVPRADG
jgi:hypothetical protein